MSSHLEAVICLLFLIRVIGYFSCREEDQVLKHGTGNARCLVKVE